MDFPGITKIYDKILGSFDNKKDVGFSARKLAAFTVVVLVVVTHIKWYNSNRWEYLTAIMGLDYGFIGLCLGLTTYQALKEGTKSSSTIKEVSSTETGATSTESTETKGI